MGTLLAEHGYCAIRTYRRANSRPVARCNSVRWSVSSRDVTLGLPRRPDRGTRTKITRESLAQGIVRCRSPLRQTLQTACYGCLPKTVNEHTDCWVGTRRVALRYVSSCAGSPGEIAPAKTGGPAAVTHRRWRRLRVSAHQRSLISRAHACNISCAYRTIFLDSDAVTRRGAAGPRHGGRARRPLDLATPAGRGAAARAAGSLGPDHGSLVPGRSGRGPPP